MYRIVLRAARLGAALCFACLTAYPQATLDNSTILTLVKSGVSDGTIITTVNQQPGRYSLSADDLMVLKKAGTSEQVIAAMIVRNQAAPLPPLVLHDGDPIRMRVAREVVSEQAKPGDTVYLEVSDDIQVAGVLVLAHGSAASGSVTRVEQKRHLVRSGKLEIAPAYVRLLNGEKVTLRAHAAPLLILVHEEDFTISKGTPFTAYVDGEFKFERRGFADSGATPQSTPPSAPGKAVEGLVEMAFTSNPQGALVTMYGAPIGKTPFFTRLAPGSYRAVFSIEGYYEIRQNFSVGPGNSNIVNAPFEMKQ